MASNKGTKVSFSYRKKGKTSIGKRAKSIKYSTMNKHKRRNFKAYRGQGK